MIVVPEANGVMIVSRDDYSMTPCGMTFTTLMGTVGGGQQTPGMMGHSKRYALSGKFIPVEGGLKRVVWLSKNIKEEFADEFKEVCDITRPRGERPSCSYYGILDLTEKPEGTLNKGRIPRPLFHG